MPGANEFDFLGGGGSNLGTTGAGSTAPGQAADPNDKAAWDRSNKASKTKNLIRTSNPYVGALDFGGGASGAYDAVSDSGRAQYDYMHDLGKNDVLTTPREFMNKMGEDVGVSHAGDAAGLGNTFQVTNPLDFNPLSPVMDPNKGLGTNAGNGGKPVASVAPNAAALAGRPIADTAGDALTQVMAGLGGQDFNLDASGADRGGMADHSGDLDRVRGLADSARGLGSDVLTGKVAAPNAADAQRQGDVLDQALGFTPSATAAASKKADAFAKSGKAARDVMGQVDAFAQGPEGPSSAQLLQDEASQKAMADVLSVSRSGRARDAGSQARAANVAQGEIAGMGVDNARNAALLRNKEANDARTQQLQALGLSTDLAQGLDTNALGTLNLQSDLAKSRDATALGALNLGADVANQARTAGIAERGQGLDFMQGAQQIGAGLEGDVLQTIPALENVRHADQFDLTPQQKLVQAKLGGAPDKTTADYVTALLGDVLGAAF